MTYTTYTVIGRMPPTWKETGVYALTEQGYEKYVELICDRLPDEVEWACCDELIAPIDFDADSFDINEIVNDAFSELAACDDPDIWEDY